MESKRYAIIYEYEEKHWWYKGRRQFLELILKGLKIPNDAKILDVGCGGGYNLHVLSKYGDTYGVDNNKNAVTNCKRRGFKNVFFVKDGLSFPFKKSSFDLITCLDVLEHVKDEDIFLKSLMKLLSPKGKLILFVPAFPILWSRLDVSSHHYRRYTKNTLSKTAALNDYVIEKIDYFNSFFFFPILLIRLLQKTPLLKTSSYGIYPKIGSSILNSLLLKIFALEIVLKPYVSFPFGVSLFALLTPSTPKAMRSK